MNKAKRFLTMLLVAISVFVMAVPAFATTEDTIDTISVGSNYTLGERREKNSSTAAYLYMASAPTSHLYVQLMGCNSQGGSTVNKTSYKDAKYEYTHAAYVICRVDAKYSVHNSAYEDGYRNVRFNFKTISGYSGRLTYQWSPDSSGTYISAT